MKKNKHIQSFTEHQGKQTNEFFIFNSKNKDVEFADELLKKIDKGEYVSIGSNLKGYNVIFKDKSISVKKKREFGITGYPKDVYELYLSQNKERREVDCSQSTKKKIYEIVDKKFKN